MKERWRGRKGTFMKATKTKVTLKISMAVKMDGILREWVFNFLMALRWFSLTLTQCYLIHVCLHFEYRSRKRRRDSQSAMEAWVTAGNESKLAADPKTVPLCLWNLRNAEVFLRQCLAYHELFSVSNDAAEGLFYLRHFGTHPQYVKQTEAGTFQSCLSCLTLGFDWEYR